MANEEFFKLKMEPSSPCVFRSRDLYTVIFVEGWLLSFGYIYFCCWHMHRLVAPPPDSYFFAVLLVVWHILATAMGTMPQRVEFIPGERTCEHYWGISFLSIRHRVPMAEIEGVVLDTKKQEAFVNVQLIMRWRVSRPPFIFATYQNREFGIRRARFISETTGLPLLVYGYNGTVQAYAELS